MVEHLTIPNEQRGRARRFLAVAAGVAMLSGCSVVGPSAVRVDRAAYNLALEESGNQQLLLNLLRLRDGEAIYTLELTSVLSQFEMDTRAQIGGWWNNIDRIDNNVVNAWFGLDTFATRQSTWGVNAAFIERPTITYTPLQGERFAVRYMQPIPITALLRLVESGWRADLIFECCVQRINELSNRPLATYPDEGPVPTDQFYEFTRILAEWQRAGQLRFDLVAEGKDVYLVFNPLSAQVDPRRTRVAELLGMAANCERVRLVEQSTRTPDAIAVQTRSLLGIAQALVRDNAEGPTAPETTAADPGSQTRTPWLTIRRTKMPARDAYVQVERGSTWHSIANSDQRSKQTFALLVYLSSLRASDIGGVAPLVTVSSN